MPKPAALLDWLDRWLEGERDQLPLLFVVAFGGGIVAWLALPGERSWTGFLLLALAGFTGGLAALHHRLGRVAAWGGAAMALGCALIWWRAGEVATPRIERPVIAEFTATVERVEPLAARGLVRLTVAPEDASLPPLLRISVRERDSPPTVTSGSTVAMRARLTPPPPMMLPGGHDFARDYWFRGIGGAGRAVGPVELLAPGPSGGLDDLRNRLGRAIRQQLPGSEGAIATALATGDQAALSEEDAEAMRRSGLTHLLSVSGLHIAAVVGAAMLLTLRLLALSERLALRFNLVLVAAGAGAIAGIAYTLLTGAQVPTVRSCIAAILVLVGIALGREALSLRLVAVGALVILLFRPEAIAGASFQFSFAAVTAIVVLHSSRFARRHFASREEGLAAKGGRAILSLVLTGLAVEAALVPLALYHFHKAGLYSVAANVIGIPLTTFVIMPLEALALLTSAIGIGGAAWWATGEAIGLLLDLARWVAAQPGSVAMRPAMPAWAFAAMVSGGLWLIVWRSRARLLGMVPALAGAVGAWAAPVPQILVSGDGRHVAVIGHGGQPALLRDRAGDFVRSTFAEAAGFDGDPAAFANAGARCSADSCLVDVRQGSRSWRLLAIRSRERIDWRLLVRACAGADIVVADRMLPRGCVPRWLKLDRPALERLGGVAIHLGSAPRVDSVAARVAGHPWGAPSSNDDERAR